MADVTTLRGMKKTKTIPGFECGAVVCLRSGGAAMTVREGLVFQDSSPMVRVDWTGADGSPLGADYFVAQLMRFDDLLSQDPEDET